MQQIVAKELKRLIKDRAGVRPQERRRDAGGPGSLKESLSAIGRDLDYAIRPVVMKMG